MLGTLTIIVHIYLFIVDFLQLYGNQDYRERQGWMKAIEAIMAEFEINSFWGAVSNHEGPHSG